MKTSLAYLGKVGYPYVAHAATYIPPNADKKIGLMFVQMHWADELGKDHDPWIPLRLVTCDPPEDHPAYRIVHESYMALKGFCDAAGIEDVPEWLDDEEAFVEAIHDHLSTNKPHLRMHLPKATRKPTFRRYLGPQNLKGVTGEMSSKAMVAAAKCVAKKAKEA